MSSYGTPLKKKTVKWYRKVTFDILLSSSMVNALSLFKSVTGNSAITITIFNEQIAKQLLSNHIYHNQLL